MIWLCLSKYVDRANLETLSSYPKFSQAFKAHYLILNGFGADCLLMTAQN